MKLLALLLLASSIDAFAQSSGPVTLNCIRETDANAGVVQFNASTNVVTIQGNSWTVSPDGSGIIVSGALGTPGKFLRMNRFNGAVMARWKPTTPAGQVDFIGVCTVAGRLF